MPPAPDSENLSDITLSRHLSSPDHVRHLFRPWLSQAAFDFPKNAPAYQPDYPELHPAFPVSHPAFPVSHPASPASHPVSPASHPASPASHPVSPESLPAFPVHLSSAEKPVQPVFAETADREVHVPLPHMLGVSLHPGSFPSDLHRLLPDRYF